MRNYLLKYLWLIIRHKYYTAKYCFITKLYWRGIMHDMSKLFPVEFFESAKIYCKNNYKPEKPYCYSWLHHKGRNDHHYEFWFDTLNGDYHRIEIPYEPFAEMICDWFSANKVYDNGTPLTETQWWFYSERPTAIMMNENTIKKVDKVMLFLEQSNSFEETCKNLKRIYYES